MKKFLAVLLAVAAGVGASAQNATNNPPVPLNVGGPTSDTYANPGAGHVGVGVTFGEPIGADVKYWLSGTTAADGAIGWSTHDDSTLYIQGDLLWHKFNLLDFMPSGKLPFYFGIGGLLRFRDHGESNNVGIRVPLGVSYIFENLPVDIFVEVGPALDVTPGFRGEITGGIGMRFWF